MNTEKIKLMIETLEGLKRSLDMECLLLSDEQESLLERLKEQLVLSSAGSMFKDKCKIDIEVLEEQYKELRNDTRASFEDDDWGIRLTAIRAKIEVLTSVLNY